MQPVWRFNLFGGFRSEHGTLVVTRPQSRNVGVLLAHLLLNPDVEHSRVGLMNLLWEDCDDPELTQHRLRETICKTTISKGVRFFDQIYCCLRHNKYTK
jgi:DNA-binding SARP family transcriptional activator